MNFIVRKFIDWKINNCLTRRPKCWNINKTCLQKIFIWRGGLGSGKWGRAHKKMIDLDIIPTFRVWAAGRCGHVISQEPGAEGRSLPSPAVCLRGDCEAVISVGDVHFFRHERDQVRLRLPTIAELSFYKYILNSPATQVLDGWNHSCTIHITGFDREAQEISFLLYSILQIQIQIFASNDFVTQPLNCTFDIRIHYPLARASNKGLPRFHNHGEGPYCTY